MTIFPDMTPSKGASIALTLMFAVTGAGCSTTRTLVPTTCEDTTVVTSSITGEEIWRQKHEFSKDCLGGLITTAIVRASQKTTNAVLREQMLNVAAAAYKANPSMRTDIDRQLKAHGIQGINLLTRPTDIMFGRHPTDPTKTIMFRIQRVGANQGIPALTSAG